MRHATRSAVHEDGQQFANLRGVDPDCGGHEDDRSDHRDQAVAPRDSPPEACNQPAPPRLGVRLGPRTTPELGPFALVRAGCLRAVSHLLGHVVAGQGVTGSIKARWPFPQVRGGLAR